MSNSIVLVSNVSGVLVPRDFSGHLMSVNSGVLDRVKQSGLNLMFVQSATPLDVMADSIVADRPKGVIISSFITDFPAARRALTTVRDQGIPTVVQSGDPLLDVVDRVDSDHESGAYAEARWLLENGRRHPSTLSVPDDSWWIEAHNRGYERALAEHGTAPIPPTYVRGLIQREADSRENLMTRARQAVGFLIEHLTGPNPVDAIMVCTDCEVFVVAAACRLLGKIPGRDVLIAGYDNYWSTAPERQWEPSIPSVTVEKENHIIGESMVSLLLERIAGHLPEETQFKTVPQKLILTPESTVASPTTA